MQHRHWFTLLAASASLSALCAHGQIHTAPGFEAPNPSAAYGSQLSGMNAVYGSYDGSTVGFAAWEKFSEPMFSGFGPQYWAGGAGLRATLSQSNEDAWVSDGVSTTTSNTGLINVGGTDYYGRLTNGGYNFTIEGMATGIIQSITLQIKHSPYLTPVGMDWHEIIPFAAELSVGGETFAPEVDDGPSLPNFSDTLDLATRTAIYTYRWDNLNIGADQPFALDFFAGADQTNQGFSVDAIGLHVQVQVPEPAVVAVLLAGSALGVAALRRRRMRSA